MKEHRYISVITVLVRDADGLIDMLRYDSCFPRTEEDSYKIIRLINGSASPDDHVIELTRASRNDNGPTLGRWQSFGCKILDVRHPDAEATPIAELRKRHNLTAKTAKVLG